MATPVTLTTLGVAGAPDTPVGPANPLTVALGGYPVGVVPLAASSGNVAAAPAVATLTPGATQTAFCSGFQVSGSGSTAGLPVTVTVTGAIGGTQSYTYTFAAGALLPNTPLAIQFVPPLKATAINTPIVVTCPSGGAGNTNNSVSAQGYAG